MLIKYAIYEVSVVMAPSSENNACNSQQYQYTVHWFDPPYDIWLPLVGNLFSRTDAFYDGTRSNLSSIKPFIATRAAYARHGTCRNRVRSKRAEVRDIWCLVQKRRWTITIERLPLLYFNKTVAWNREHNAMLWAYEIGCTSSETAPNCV